jgi:hypothetical protein
VAVVVVVLLVQILQEVAVVVVVLFQEILQSLLALQ